MRVKLPDQSKGARSEMTPFTRNLLAVVVGIVVGSAVNMGLIIFGGILVPSPIEATGDDMDSLAASMHLFEPRHFLFPFLAHALGTLTGAALAAWIAASRRMLWALLIGAFFLAGGITMARLLPAPTWFIAIDLLLAYLPMAWLGGWLVTRGRATSN